MMEAYNQPLRQSRLVAARNCRPPQAVEGQHRVDGFEMHQPAVGIGLRFNIRPITVSRDGTPVVSLVQTTLRGERSPPPAEPV